MAAQAVVWGRRRLGLGTRHAGLELAHGEVLPGLGRYHRVLDVLEVVGLDRPVRSRAGGDALFDDLGNATSRRDGHHLPPMRQERLSLTSSAAHCRRRAGQEVNGLFVERARVLCRQRKEDVALELDEVLPGVALRRRAGVRCVEGA